MTVNQPGLTHHEDSSSSSSSLPLAHKPFDGNNIPATTTTTTTTTLVAGMPPPQPHQSQQQQKQQQIDSVMAVASGVVITEKTTVPNEVGKNIRNNAVTEVVSQTNMEYYNNRVGGGGERSTTETANQAVSSMTSAEVESVIKGMKTVLSTVHEATVVTPPTVMRRIQEGESSDVLLFSPAEVAAAVMEAEAAEAATAEIPMTLPYPSQLRTDPIFQAALRHESGAVCDFCDWLGLRIVDEFMGRCGLSKYLFRYCQSHQQQTVLSRIDSIRSAIASIGWWKRQIREYVENTQRAKNGCPSGHVGDDRGAASLPPLRRPMDSSAVTAMQRSSSNDYKRNDKSNLVTVDPFVRTTTVSEADGGILTVVAVTTKTPKEKAGAVAAKSAETTAQLGRPGPEIQWESLVPLPVGTVTLSSEPRRTDGPTGNEPATLARGTPTMAKSTQTMIEEALDLDKVDYEIFHGTELNSPVTDTFSLAATEAMAGAADHSIQDGENRFEVDGRKPKRGKASSSSRSTGQNKRKMNLRKDSRKRRKSLRLLDRFRLPKIRGRSSPIDFTLQTGMRIECSWEMSSGPAQWFPATVLSLSGNKMKIQYDDETEPTTFPCKNDVMWRISSSNKIKSPTEKRTMKSRASNPTKRTTKRARQDRVRLPTRPRSNVLGVSKAAGSNRTGPTVDLVPVTCFCLSNTPQTSEKTDPRARNSDISKVEMGVVGTVDTTVTTSRLTISMPVSSAGQKRHATNDFDLGTAKRQCPNSKPIPVAQQEEDGGNPPSASNEAAGGKTCSRHTVSVSTVAPAAKNANAPIPKSSSNGTFTSPPVVVSKPSSNLPTATAASRTTKKNSGSGRPRSKTEQQRGDSRKASVQRNVISSPLLFPLLAPLYQVGADDALLTKYQCLLRKQLLLFEAKELDVKVSRSPGRAGLTVKGQVGLRCRHCCGNIENSKSKLTKGAIYYSNTIGGMYQIAQNMAKLHLLERCEQIPSEVRNALVLAKGEHQRVKKMGGKRYWSETFSLMGCVDADSKVFIHRANSVR